MQIWHGFHSGTILASNGSKTNHPLPSRANLNQYALWAMNCKSESGMLYKDAEIWML